MKTKTTFKRGLQLFLDKLAASCDSKLLISPDSLNQINEFSAFRLGAKTQSMSGRLLRATKTWWL